MTLLLLQPPADNERGPSYLEGLIAGWVAMTGDSGLSLGLASRDGRVAFVLRVNGDRQRVTAAQVLNAFPGSSVDVLSDSDELTSVLLEKGLLRSGMEVRRRSLMLNPDVFSLRLHSSFVEQHSRETIDPLEALLEVLKSGRSGRISTVLWLQLKPARDWRMKDAVKCAAYWDGTFRWQFLKRMFRKRFVDQRWPQRVVKRILMRLAKPSIVLEQNIAEKLSQHLLEASLSIVATGDGVSGDLLLQKITDVQATLKQLTAAEAAFVEDRSGRGSFLLNAAEVATLWHPPVKSVHVPRLQQSMFRELEPPMELAGRGQGSSREREVGRGGVTLGRVCFRNERQKFGMDLEARRRHCYVLGKTGMGKTTLLQNVLMEDIVAGRGCAVFDPHGDLATTLLDVVPKSRTNDVVLFDPADREFAIAFNPLQVPKGGDATLVADGVLSAFSKVFGFDESQAPRMLHIFRNCLLTLVEMPEATLLSVQRLMLDPMYRKTATAFVSNPVVRSFWTDEFGKWKPQDRTAFIASLQNKLGAFLTNDKLQRILGQPKGKVDLRQIMDDGKILIVNLSKGTVGENASDLLGSLLVTSLQLAAMSRANIPERDRRDFSIVIDEFQNYATPAIATFLSEARKYRTHLILSHQFTAQLPPEILSAVLGNVGSMVVFQIGADDAELFERQLGGHVTVDNLMNIPKFHAYCRLLIDGMPSRPFSMQTIEPTRVMPRRATIVRKVSRQLYSRQVF